MTTPTTHLSLLGVVIESFPMIQGTEACILKTPYTL